MRHSQDHHARLQLETLETRHLLAGQVLLNPVTGLLTINGTPGVDHARVALENGAVLVNLTSDGISQNASFSPALVRKIAFQGFEGDDRFLNDLTVPCTLRGGAGHDYLEGSAGLDYLFGDDGNDILVGFSGNDRLLGGNGNDLLFGMAGNDAMAGHAGLDQLFGGVGRDALRDTTAYRDGVTDGPLAQVALQYSVKLDDLLAPPVVPPVVPPGITLSALETAVINLTNQARQAAGLPPLQVNAQLVSAARHHAGNMARLDNMAHSLPGADLPNLVDRLNRYGYNYQFAGENIAWNYPSAESVMAGWMASSGHRQNILNPNFTEIGVGIAYNRLGEPYYCQVFGRRM